MRIDLKPDIQEKVFKALLSIPENKICADCLGKNPTWASLDFGVFICYNCSGFHRELGPTVTRVKSLTLDKWNTEWIEIMASHGNSKSNEFWENKIPAHYTKPKADDEMRKFIQDKYLRKTFVPKNKRDPISTFLIARQRKELPEFNLEELIGENPENIVKQKSPFINNDRRNFMKWQQKDDYNNFATYQPKKNKDLENNLEWKTFDKKHDENPIIVPEKVQSIDWAGQKIQRNDFNDNSNWLNFSNNNNNNKNKATGFENNNNNNNKKTNCFDERAFKTVSAMNRQDLLDSQNKFTPKNEPILSTDLINFNYNNTPKTKIQVSTNTKQEVANLLDFSPKLDNLVSPNTLMNRSSNHQTHMRPSSVDAQTFKQKQNENSNSGNCIGQKPLHGLNPFPNKATPIIYQTPVPMKTNINNQINQINSQSVPMKQNMNNQLNQNNQMSNMNNASSVPMKTNMNNQMNQNNQMNKMNNAMFLQKNEMNPQAAAQNKNMELNNFYQNPQQTQNPQQIQNNMLYNQNNINGNNLNMNNMGQNNNFNSYNLYNLNASPQPQFLMNQNEMNMEGNMGFFGNTNLMNNNLGNQMQKNQPYNMNSDKILAMYNNYNNNTMSGFNGFNNPKEFYTNVAKK